MAATRWSCPRNRMRQFSKGWRKPWNLLKQQDVGEGTDVAQFSGLDSEHFPLNRYNTQQCLGRISLNEDIILKF